MNFDDILHQLGSENEDPGTPADEALFEQVERRHGIKLAPTFGYVYGLGATRLGLAASSFSEFVARVAVDSDELHSYG